MAANPDADPLAKLQAAQTYWSDPANSGLFQSIFDSQVAEFTYADDPQRAVS